ncbi:hypothetical protein DLAC_05310 [Tieghemostelium lacteum]|uniref:Uncharacterized protein n=1 Tax=Tieghemostelium lacteum TaxID=361077 RepID=A0A151ZIX4_TIELA|nr:hypothetical protein DLAC_05310 [Tieghemostelium lacteum]|eukprot:KYQ93906.1 hypothetical protein DLAC_05310 [Tieghemostelium lacteum]
MELRNDVFGRSFITSAKKQNEFGSYNVVSHGTFIDIIHTPRQPRAIACSDFQPQPVTLHYLHIDISSEISALCRTSDCIGCRVL